MNILETKVSRRTALLVGTGSMLLSGSELARAQESNEKPYALSVNGDVVSWEVFSRRVAYTQHILGTADEGQAKQRAANELIKDLLIHQTALSLGITVPEEELQRRTAGNQDPEHVFGVMTALLQEQLEPQIVAKRSGRTIFVPFGFSRQESPPPVQTWVPQQRSLALAKITTARREVLAGRDISEVASELERDSEVMQLTEGGILLIPFALDRSRELYSTQVTESLFTASTGEVTPVVVVANDPSRFGRRSDHREFAFLFAVIDDATPGTEVSFGAWLAKAKEEATIVSYLE